MRPQRGPRVPPAKLLRIELDLLRMLRDGDQHWRYVATEEGDSLQLGGERSEPRGYPAQTA